MSGDPGAGGERGEESGIESAARFVGERTRWVPAEAVPRAAGVERKGNVAVEVAHVVFRMFDELCGSGEGLQ